MGVAVCKRGGVMDKDIELLRELKVILQAIELLKLLEEETDEQTRSD